METNDASLQNSRSLTTTYKVVVLCTFCLFLTLPADAQKRNPDLILTVKKDTLSVKIVEVDISDLKYRNLTDDTATTYTILKADILRVFYGNGDEEVFKPSSRAQPIITGRRYYKMVLKTPFQKEIAQWPTEKLLVEKNLYKQKYLSQKVGGIVAFPVGGILVAVGFAQAIASIFSSDNSSGAPAFISGIVVATGLGIPLTILGANNKKKYRAIISELDVRGETVN